MRTIVAFAVNENAPGIKDAAKFLKQGELVAFPTETVYGLGADGLNPEAVKKIYEVKGRPQDNPLILHIADLDMLPPLVEDLDDYTISMLSRLWPGPLTMIFPKSKLVPDIVTAGGKTVAIRMPLNDVARAMIREAGTPIAAPSANKSGRPSPTRAEDVLEDLGGEIPMILNGGYCDFGVESTVVDLTRKPVTILRPGFYTADALMRFFPDIVSPEDRASFPTGVDELLPPPDLGLSFLDRMDPAEAYRRAKAQNMQEDSEIPRSPGMKYKHYAPKADVTVYMGSFPGVVRRMIHDAKIKMGEGKKIGFMAFDLQIPVIRKELGNVPICTMGDGHFLVTMAQNLFTSMRELDRMGCDEIFSVGVSSIYVGTAIMNRLRKAAGGHVIRVDEG